jgi:hypothetical protein
MPFLEKQPLVETLINHSFLMKIINEAIGKCIILEGIV